MPGACFSSGGFGQENETHLNNSPTWEKREKKMLGTDLWVDRNMGYCNIREHTSGHRYPLSISCYSLETVFTTGPPCQVPLRRFWMLLRLLFGIRSCIVTKQIFSDAVNLYKRYKTGSPDEPYEFKRQVGKIRSCFAWSRRYNMFWQTNLVIFHL